MSLIFYYLGALLVVMTLVSPYVQLPIWCLMIPHAVWIVFIGSYLSLNKRLEDLREKRATEALLSPADAKLAPFIASIALLGLYLAIKHLNTWVVSTFTIMNIGITCTTSFAICFLELMHKFLPMYASPSLKFCRSFSGFIGKYVIDKIEIDYSTTALMGYALGAVLYILWHLTENWLLNNVIATVICVTTIKNVSLGTFATGNKLLAGLFCYDVFWVYMTDVMVSVAKRFKAPIKILFPRGNGEFSLLGLGDIVLPGLYIALALRFDQKLMRKGKWSPKHFRSCLIAYGGALAATVWAMHAYQTAQPALLFISPLLIFGFLVSVCIFGNYSEAWEYDESQQILIEEEREVKSKIPAS